MACQFVFSYFIKLGTTFTVGKNLPATRSVGKQNIKLKKMIVHDVKANQVNHNTLGFDVNFPSLDSRLPVSNYCSTNFSEELAPFL